MFKPRTSPRNEVRSNARREAEVQDFPRVRSQRSAVRAQENLSQGVQPQIVHVSPSLQGRACVWRIGLRMPPFCLALLKAASFLALLKFLFILQNGAAAEISAVLVRDLLPTPGIY